MMTSQAHAKRLGESGGRAVARFTGSPFRSSTSPGFRWRFTLGFILPLATAS
jgi:hypothetical protein